MIARERVFCDEKRRMRMSKEIDWNTVETVWDYEKEFDVALKKEFCGSKEKYVEKLKESKKPNIIRLKDLWLLFALFKDVKRLKEVAEKAGKDLNQVRTEVDLDYQTHFWGKVKSPLFPELR